MQTGVELQSCRRTYPEYRDGGAQKDYKEFPYHRYAFHIYEILSFAMNRPLEHNRYRDHHYYREMGEYF
jgi:hypothetical protein